MRGHASRVVARSGRSRMSAWVADAVSALRTIAGAPNYERYVQHLRLHHPGTAPLTRDEFTRERLARRYDSPGSRCC
jgi:uncharacterized short protein YbdD (DUF466 family)